MILALRRNHSHSIINNSAKPLSSKDVITKLGLFTVRNTVRPGRLGGTQHMRVRLYAR